MQKVAVLEQNLADHEQYAEATYATKNDLYKKADIIKNTASGAIASFADGADGHLVDELKVQIEPVQDLHGYDHPWPAGGGKNKFNTDFSDTTINGTAITKLSDGKVSTSGVPTSAFDLVIGTVTLPAGEYILNGCPAGGGATKYRLQVTDFPVRLNLGQDSGSGVSFTLSEEMVVAVRIQVYTGASASLTFAPMIRLASETDATFAPYSNICPITGWDGVKVTRTGKNLLDWQDDGYVVSYYRVIDIPAGNKQKLYMSIIDKNPSLELPSSTSIGFVLSDYAGTLLSNNEYRWVIINNTIRTNHSNTTGGVSPSDGTLLCGRVLIYPRDANTLNAIRQRFDIAVYTEDNVPTYEPYSENTYDITLPTEAGTVYGGELTVNADGSGSLVVDRVKRVFDGSSDENIGPYNSGYDGFYIRVDDANINGTPAEQLKANYLVGVPRRGDATGYKFALKTYSSPSDNKWFFVSNTGITDYYEFKAYLANNNLEVLYPLETPITYTLTASQIRTLLGQNNIWSDAGDVSVKYNADTKLYIDNKITQAIAAALNS